MNYKHLEDWNSGTVKKILYRHPNGFVGFTIQGERGQGKSMYAYKVTAKIYQILDELDEFDAYKKALKHFIFEPRELVNLIKHNIKNDYITPVICLDDATVHFNSYKFFVDLYEVILLKGMFDTIRTALTGLLITCPNRKHLLSFMRNYNDYKIEIKQDDGKRESRLARCYQFNWMPDERRYKVIVPFQDKYSYYVPGNQNDIDTPYGAYYAKRKRYLEAINKELEQKIKEQDAKKAARKLKNKVRMGKT